MRFRDRLRVWWDDPRAGWVTGFVIGAVILTAFTVVRLSPLWPSGVAEDPEIPVTVPTATPAPTIVPPASMADLIARPTPAPNPALPALAIRQQDVVTIASPLSRRLTYAQGVYVKQHFPGDDYRAARTAWCESMFRVDARGKLAEVGVFQIHPGHFGTYAYEDGTVIDFASVGLLAEDERRAYFVEAAPWLAEIVETWSPGSSRTYDGIVAILTDERIGMHANAQVARYLYETDIAAGGDGWGPWTTRYGCEGWQG